MVKAWKQYAIIFPIGAVLTVFGLVVGILWSTIYSNLVTTQISLSPSSANYDLWKETPIPMYLKLYMFNLTNPEALTSGNVLPHFEEMGPYVLREVDSKVQLVWNDNGTISYQRKRVWHFDESLSKGNLLDKVTNLNPVAASIVYTLRYQRVIVRDLVDRFMYSMNEPLVITKTVQELLFDGYDDKVLKFARKLKLTKIPMDRFAWFYGRNGSASYDGTFNMLTGATNLLDLGIVTTWNYDDKVSYYDGECAKVRGTNGDLWPPLPDNKTVTFFVSDICTSLSATYENTTEYEGITGVRYINDEMTLANGDLDPSRKCYCRGECIPSGALNISLCKWGAPAFISFPHFYLADPSYTAKLSGLNPSKENHELKIALEPTTGVPLEVSAKLQLNLLLLRDEHMKIFKNVPNNTFVPILWFAQEAYLTSDYSNTVKLVLILRTLGSVTAYGIAAIGIMILCIGIFLCIRRSWKGEENQILLDRSDINDIHGIN